MGGYDQRPAQRRIRFDYIEATLYVRTSPEGQEQKRGQELLRKDEPVTWRGGGGGRYTAGVQTRGMTQGIFGKQDQQEILINEGKKISRISPNLLA